MENPWDRLKIQACGTTHIGVKRPLCAHCHAFRRDNGRGCRRVLLAIWLSPRPRKSIHRTFRCCAFTDTRLSESFLCDYSSYSTVFEVWGYCITFFADVKQKFYRTALSAQHFQQLRGGVRDVFRAGNFQFLAAAEPPADGDQRQTGVAGRGHIYLAVAHIHGIFRVDAES